MKEDRENAQKETLEPEAGKARNRRDCYCGLWDTDPEYLKREGIPKGYCGLCQVCGQPGHTRHHPGSVPYTGAWCDRHYRKLAWTHPLAFPGTLLWAGAVIGVFYLVAKLF